VDIIDINDQYKKQKKHTKNHHGKWIARYVLQMRQMGIGFLKHSKLDVNRNYCLDNFGKTQHAER